MIFLFLKNEWQLGSKILTIAKQHYEVLIYLNITISSMKNMLNMSPMTDQAFSHPYSKAFDNSLARLDIDTLHEQGASVKLLMRSTLGLYTGRNVQQGVQSALKVSLDHSGLRMRMGMQRL